MQWKQTLVTDIFMKWKKSDPANHRSISLTCLCCKFIEHFVLSHITKHLSANNILLESKDLFREKLSSVAQLISSGIHSIYSMHSIYGMHSADIVTIFAEVFTF